MGNLLHSCLTRAVAVERAWLSWSAPPPSVAFAESTWKPDEPGAWCPRCGATGPPCAACSGPGAAPFDHLVRLGAFEGDLADWIRAIKYRRWEPMGVALGALLARAARRAFPADAAPPVVVPMPMPLIRRIQRGIDHTATIAGGVASALRCPIARPLVHAGGPPQVTLSASQRRQRTAPVALRRHGLFGGRIFRHTLVLVDDVTTTGTTLRAAARLLRSLGPSAVIAAVLAVADRPADDLA